MKGIVPKRMVENDKDCVFSPHLQWHLLFCCASKTVDRLNKYTLWLFSPYLHSIENHIVLVMAYLLP